MNGQEVRSDIVCVCVCVDARSMVGCCAAVNGGDPHYALGLGGQSSTQGIGIMDTRRKSMFHVCRVVCRAARCVQAVKWRFKPPLIVLPFLSRIHRGYSLYDTAPVPSFTLRRSPQPLVRARARARNAHPSPHVQVFFLAKWCFSYGWCASQRVFVMRPSETNWSTRPIDHPNHTGMHSLSGLVP